MARSSSGGVAIRYVLSVYVWWQEEGTQKAYTQRDSRGGSTDLTPRYILKLIHQEAASDRGGAESDICDCLLYALLCAVMTM